MTLTDRRLKPYTTYINLVSKVKFINPHIQSPVHDIDFVTMLAKIGH